jgi:hypothetical protein
VSIKEDEGGMKEGKRRDEGGMKKRHRGMKEGQRGGAGRKNFEIPVTLINFCNIDQSFILKENS